MKKHLLALLVVLSSCSLFTGSALAHCEIPCGIYDDSLRMKLIYEHASTIEKSMTMIAELEKSKDNANQLVRWITNKDHHADLVQEIVSQYFMTQRIKFDAKDYDQKLTALHKMLVFSMQCKQTIDPANVEKLRAAAQEFEKLYFGHSH